jgi:prepilin-type N-terminal cleavage/methylation domain-containing protein
VRDGERGFTLIEVLLAIAIALPVALALIGVVRASLSGVATARTLAAASAQMDELVERLDAESHSAAALFSPAHDVLGGTDCGPHGRCRELDFFTRDTQGVPHFWAYRYDPSGRSLQRYVYDDLRESGPVNLRASGPPLAGIADFSVAHVPISQVAIPPLGTYVPKDVAVPLGYDGVAGGNELAIVDLRDAVFHLHHELVPRLAASGFTVVVGTYTPAPGFSPSPAPSAPGNYQPGVSRAYLSYEWWRIGPCVNEPPDTPGCGPGGLGQGQEQEGDAYGLGGALVAPAGTQIPLADICQVPNLPQNPNVQIPIGQYDSLGRLYAVVRDPVLGVSEAWMPPAPLHGDEYLPPNGPLSPPQGGENNPYATQLDNGPGYSYTTIFEISC